MSILEIIAVVSTIGCIVLSAKELILAWPVGIISVLALIGVYIGGGMYAQILLQLVFLVQCIIGWFNWGKIDAVKLNLEEKEPFIISLVVSIALGSVYGIVVIWLNDSKNIVFSFVDGISAFIALLGNWYLTKKTIQAWPLFMVYNLLIGTLLFSQGIYSLALLNLIAFFISFKTFYTWKRNLKAV